MAHLLPQRDEGERQGEMMARVGVETGAMSFLLAKLTALRSDEYRSLPKSVRREIDSLEPKLRQMYAKLERLADKEKLEPDEKDWKGKVRELSYDFEDCIDRYMDRVGSGDTKRWFVKKFVRRLKKLWARHEIATQIKELKARVMEESQRGEVYELDSPSPEGPVEIHLRQPVHHEETQRLVGMDGPVNKITDWLTEESAEVKVVAIVGMGGVGKTTLAREIYRKLGDRFPYRAWIYVSHQPDPEKLLKNVLAQISEDEFNKCQSEVWDKEQLIREMARFLRGKRYFISIDDLWREDDWKILKAAFPESHNGSRIIVTTRDTAVAESCSSGGHQLYKLEPLSVEDSEELFSKRIFGSESFTPELQDIAARIVKRCAGLPLAISALSSFLANETSIDEWERVERSIGSSHSVIEPSYGNVRHSLLLSYWHLPRHLKSCLLYLCIYPKDHFIQCEELKLKWIAEGFIDEQRGNLDQVAEDCLLKLLGTSMIEAVDVDYGGSVKSCRVHDLVLEILMPLSNEENFSTILEGGVCNSLPDKVRRLSVQSIDKDHEEVINAIEKSKLHIRSVNMFGNIEQIPTLVDFHALRLMDLQGYWWLQNKDVSNVGCLSQLRYLRLGGRRITELPKEIGKLRYLETLDLRGCLSVRKLPSTMVRLQKLVRLFVHDTLVMPADGFGDMQALEELSTVGESDDPVKFAEELGYLTKLRKLSIIGYVTLLKARPGDPEERILDILRLSLNKLGNHSLQYLHTRGDIGDYVFRDPNCTFPHLLDLNVSTPMERVGTGMTSLQKVVKLDITVSAFDEEGLRILSAMTSLSHLQLTIFKQADITEKPIVGSEGFNRLEVFHYKITRSHGLGIAFEAGAMPALGRLRVRLHAREVMSGYWRGADLGIKHLSGLEDLHVEIDCYCATRGDVEAVEGSIKKEIALHPKQRLQLDPNKRLQFHTSRTGETGRKMKERSTQTDGATDTTD